MLIQSNLVCSREILEMSGMETLYTINNMYDF